MNEQNEQNYGADQEQSRQQYQSQYQPQYQSQYQSQYQYQPQYQYPPQYQPQLFGGRGGGWITLLRVFLWIEFFSVVFVGAGLFAFFLDDDRVLVGILALVGAVIVAFLSVALGMVLLDAANNIKILADNSAAIGASILRREQQDK